MRTDSECGIVRSSYRLICGDDEDYGGWVERGSARRIRFKMPTTCPSVRATARCSHTLSGRQSFMRRPEVAVRVPGALTHWVSARSVGWWRSVITRRLA